MHTYIDESFYFKAVTINLNTVKTVPPEGIVAVAEVTELRPEKHVYKDTQSIVAKTTKPCKIVTPTTLDTSRALGKIITVGYANTESSDSDFLLARLSPRGSLDSTFGVGGKVRTSFGDLNGGANGAAFQSDGKIVAVGFQATFSNRWSDFALARYLDGQ